MSVPATAAPRPDPVRQPLEPRRATAETKPKKSDDLEPKELDIDNLPCTD